MAKNFSAIQRLASLAGIPSDTDNSTASHEATAEQIALHRVDDAQAVPRPTSIGPLWVELEYDALRDEQHSLWEAAGRESTRQIEAEADGLRLAAEARERGLRGHEPVLDAAAQRYADTVEALSPFRRRPTGTKWLHYSAKAALLLGDMVGVTVMGINIGDYPILAFLLSIAAATAAVTAGLVGAEVRDLRMAQRRLRDIGTLSPMQQPFEHLFSCIDDGKRMVKLLCGVSAVIALAIAAGIFAGRAALEGPLVGLIYGGFAAAVAAASLVESYMYADEIADHIDTAAASYKKELALHDRLASSQQWRDRQQKISETASIISEHAARGEAAGHRVRALKWSILRRNAGVAGHGPALHQQERSDRVGGER